MSHPDVLRLLISVGITVVAFILSLLSAFVYVRERERRLLIVTVAYGLIFFRGALTLIETVGDAISGESHALFAPEVVDHLTGLAILIALVLFFVAIARDPRR